MMLAKEVWQYIRREQVKVTGDHLGCRDLASIYDALRRSPASEMTRGPLRSIKTGLEFFGITLVDSTTMKLRSGQEVSLQFGSPAMLNKYLVREYEEIQNTLANEYLGSKGRTDKDLEWYSIRKVLRSKKIKAKVKSAAMQVITGTVPTPAWQHQHGRQIDPACECGEMCSLDHISQGCEHHNQGEATSKHEADLIVKSLEKLARPTVDYHPKSVFRKDGQIAQEHEVRWDSDYPVYTDGSATNICLPGMEHVAYAVVQLQPVKQVIYEPISKEFLQSATTAEHVAAVRAALHTQPGEQIQLGTDCQAVVQGYMQPNVHKFSFKSLMAGYWAQVGTAFRMVTKVKAHLSSEQAEARGELSHHEGNDQADHYANQARPSYKQREEKDFIQAFKQQIDPWLEAASRISGDDRCRIAPAPARSGTKVRRHRHQSRWMPTIGKWGCVDCGATSRVPARLTSKPCTALPAAIREAHFTHCLSRALVEQDGTYLFFCTRCGYYGQYRADGLRKRCMDTRPTKRGGTCSSAGTVDRKRTLNRISNGLNPQHSSSATVAMVSRVVQPAKLSMMSTRGKLLPHRLAEPPAPRPAAPDPPARPCHPFGDLTTARLSGRRSS